MSANISSPQPDRAIKPRPGTAARLPSADGPTATILLCTFNGEHFLAQQLASLKRQTFKNWKLIASDDGSSDQTKSILRAFGKSFAPGKVKIIDGPRRGAPANFLFLACGKNLASDYYAFCDQDDVWEADKLARAISILEQPGLAVPALYGSRTSLIDETGKTTGLPPCSPKRRRFAARSCKASPAATPWFQSKGARAAGVLRRRHRHTVARLVALPSDFRLRRLRAL